MAHQHVLLCKHNIVSYGSERRYTPLPEVATETPAKGRASSPDAEMAFKSGLSDPGAKTSITNTGRSPSKHSRAVGNSPLNSTGQPTRAAGNSPSGPGESNEGATALAKMMQRRPFKHKTQVEFYALPAGVKVQPEGLGLDHLKNCASSLSQAAVLHERDLQQHDWLQPVDTLQAVSLRAYNATYQTNLLHGTAKCACMVYCMLSYRQAGGAACRAAAACSRYAYNSCIGSWTLLSQAHCP